jgi:hypothetical protein
MLLGAVWCPKERVRDIANQIRSIKNQHNAKGELKWSKISPHGRLPFYEALVRYFFSNDILNFRCLVVVGKEGILDHNYFNQGSHDSFYYKMYYQLLLNIVDQEESQFNIYLDIKDTRGSRRLAILREILQTKLRNRTSEIIQNTQLVRSHESQLIQLADFLTGAMAYENRTDIPKDNEGKVRIVELIKQLSRTDLRHTSPPWDKKFNLFIFKPRSPGNA